jgi:uncharacterized protein (TIGR02996 family)
MTPDAFMAAICDAPADDGPRLVYADWLEERGDTGRAEFIRVQCELAAPGPCAAADRASMGRTRQVGKRHSCYAWVPKDAAQLRRRERMPLVAHPANPHWLGKPDPLIDSHPHRYVAAGGPTIVAHGRRCRRSGSRSPAASSIASMRRPPT